MKQLYINHIYHDLPQKLILSSKQIHYVQSVRRIAHHANIPCIMPHTHNSITCIRGLYYVHTIEKSTITLYLSHSLPSTQENYTFHVYCALIKNHKKMKSIIRMLTELNVHHIHLITTDYTNFHNTNTHTHHDKYTTTITEAIQQCNRHTIAQVHYHPSIQAAYNTQVPDTFCVVSHPVPMHPQYHIAAITPNNTRSYALYIGPEGGFSTQELEFFSQQHAHYLYLGATILRSETAASVATGIMRSHLEQLYNPIEA